MLDRGHRDAAQSAARWGAEIRNPLVVVARETGGEFRILEAGCAQPHAGIQHHGVDVVAVGVAEHSLDRPAVDVGRLADPVLGWASGARAGVFGIVAALDEQTGSADGTGRVPVPPGLHGLERVRWVLRDVPVGIDYPHNSLPSAGSMVLY